MNSTIEETKEANKQKLNIFDEDPSILKQEQLARLEFDDRALQHSDSRSMTSKSSASGALGDINKPKAIEYLSKGREQKESVKDFIYNARQILMTQIAINDKTEETERLREYIQMEREKLDEAKKTFEEDKEKFQNYMNELQKKAVEIAEKVKQKTTEKNKKLQEI